MRLSHPAHQLLALLTLLAILVATHGCSRARHRLAADGEVYDVIGERNCDPRWADHDVSIDADPRSRFHDPYDPDRSPMPLDDPTSHLYMKVVDGKKGWKHWYDNGQRFDLESPCWRDRLGEYIETTDEGVVKLDVNSALKIAYVHSPANQSQLETLYLAALDVTAERFRLDTQFFGGYDARYVHNGSLIPSALRYSPVLGRWIVNPPIEGVGVERNFVTLGRPTTGNPALQVKRRFATAGEVLVGFANSFVLEFTGSDANFAASIANFSVIQPLLRGAGRDVALEQLTDSERDLLANLRAYHQYRQGFYTNIAIGELGVTGLQRNGFGTSLTSFGGSGFLGGYIGLLQQLQQIRNSEDNLSLQLRTLAQLEALLDVGVIDLVQVDNFRQNVETERSRLLQSRNALQLALDRYKVNTLGLPPDLEIELDDSLIEQFQLVPREATEVQDMITTLQDKVGDLPDDASVEQISKVIVDATALIVPIGKQLGLVRADLDTMDKGVPNRERAMTDDEKEQFQADNRMLHSTLDELEGDLEETTKEIEDIRGGLSDETREVTTRKLVVWLGRALPFVQRSILVQARARLESVTIETIDLDPKEAFTIALSNRLDFMNGRAALVDSWRLIQFNADALQSVLNLTSSGEIRTARNNAVSFRAPTSNVRFGVEFDAPFTRLLERNAYRESLINYQRDRRSFIRSRDSLQLGLRALLREVTQLRKNLEIQRRAVAIAIRRVDLTRAALYAPVPPPQPGQRAAQFGPTAAINLLASQSSLRDTQNAFLTAWLNYRATKMRLARELGVLMMDCDGVWLDEPLPGSGSGGTAGTGAAGTGSAAEGTRPAEELPAPPAVPQQWFEMMDVPHPAPGSLPPAGHAEPIAAVDAISGGTLRRLPPTADVPDTDGYNSLQ